MSNIHGYVVNDPSAAATAATNQPVPHDSQNIPLRKCEWYFGNISREEAREKLTHARDGTFLVRNATSGNGENHDYTLTLKKDGMDRVIKIYNNNGQYGFTKGIEGQNFSSVPDLIRYYKNTSLKGYNTILDIKLMYPVSKFQEEDATFEIKNDDEEKLIHDYIQNHKEFLEKESSLDTEYQNYKIYEEKLNYTRIGFELYVEGTQMFEDHKILQDTFLKNCQPHEISSFKENIELTKNRFALFKLGKNELSIQYKKDQEKLLALQRNVQSLRPLLQSLRKREEFLLSQLHRRGIKDDQLKEIMEQGYKTWLAQQSLKLPHLDEKTWYLPDISRADAESLLYGTPTGTFLIRSRNVGGYALTITCNGPNHCIINHTDTGFGFAEPFNIFESLLALVKHYYQNSLEEHNDLLQTTLRYPVMSSYILNLKEQQKKQDNSDVSGTGDNSGMTLSGDISLNSASANSLGIPYPAFSPK